MKLRLGIAIPAVFVALATNSQTARATWPADGLYLNSLSQSTPGLSFDFASDNAGGIFMNWNNTLQRISPDGDLLLGANGTVLDGTVQTGCAADGSGGVFAAGVVGFQLQLYRFDAQGALVWQALAGATTYAKSNVYVSSDGAGGALVAWSEARPLASPDDKKIAYCQRVDGNGNVLWNANGVLVKKRQWTPPGQPQPDIGVDVIVTDVCEATPGGTAGGAIVMSGDDPPFNNAFIGTAYATAVSHLGVVVGEGGAGGPYMFAISDGAGGVFASRVPVVFPYLAYGSFDLAHIQSIYRFGPNGQGLWGVPLGVNSNTRHGAAIARTLGGVVAAWIQDGDVYTQKVSDAGTALWAASGIPVCAVPLDQSQAVVADDFSGGAYVAWSDARYIERSIYLQHLDQSGTPQIFGDNGFPITSQVGDEAHTTLYSDPAGHLIIAWHGAGGNYAQGFNESLVAVAISSFSARAHDGGVVLDAVLNSNLDVRGVQVYRATGEESFRLLAGTPAPGTAQFRYEDRDVQAGTRYRYQLVVSDDDGEFSSPIASLTTPALVTELRQNQPNPFNPQTSIAFTLNQAARTTLNIYAADGRHVRTLLDESRAAGVHRVTWNGTDDAGAPVSSGVYFYRLSSGRFADTRKMVLLK